MRIEVEGNELVIRVNLDTKGNLSKEGKSFVLDSTRGFSMVSTPFGQCKVGLNVIRGVEDDSWTGGGHHQKAAPQPTLIKRA